MRNYLQFFKNILIVCSPLAQNFYNIWISLIWVDNYSMGLIYTLHPLIFLMLKELNPKCWNIHFFKSKRIWQWLCHNFGFTSFCHSNIRCHRAELCEVDWISVQRMRKVFLLKIVLLILLKLKQTKEVQEQKNKWRREDYMEEKETC